MKKNIVITVNYGVTSKYITPAIEMLAQLNEYKDYNIICSLPIKTDKGFNYIEDLAHIKIDKKFRYNNLYIDQVYNGMYFNKEKKWKDFYSEYDWYKDIKNVEAIIFIMGPSLGLNGNIRNFNSQVFETANSMRYQSNGKYIANTLQLIKLAERESAQIHELKYDPLELSISKFPFKNVKTFKSYYGYKSPTLETERCDSMQYYMKNHGKQGPFAKEYDLVFGYTSVKKQRQKYFELVNNFVERNGNLNNKIFVYDKFKDIDTFVERPTYVDYISKARFTCILPAYCQNTFSIFRFVEALSMDCLPLVANDCYIKDVIETFSLNKDIINDIMIDFKTDKIKMSETERLELLSYLKTRFFAEPQYLTL